MVIRTLLIDMGNVLVHFSHERMCAQMGSLCGCSAEEIRSLLFDTGLQAEFERGSLSEAGFHRRFEAAVGQTVDVQSLRQAGSDIFELNAPMPGILDALKARGLRLVLLSNTSVAHFDFVRDRFDVLDRFDDFVLSYEVGAIKPERAIFEEAIARIGCEPQECFYTDDIADYVELGVGFGMQAEVFRDAETFSRQLRDRGISLEGNDERRSHSATGRQA